MRSGARWKPEGCYLVAIEDNVIVAASGFQTECPWAFAKINGATTVRGVVSTPQESGPATSLRPTQADQNPRVFDGASTVPVVYRPGLFFRERSSP